MKESKDKFELEMYRTFMYGLHKTLVESCKGESPVPTIRGMNLGIKMAADNLMDRLETIKKISK